jgi:ABC-2 type transport system permease protein
MKRVLYYIKIWLLMNKNAFLMIMAQKASLMIFGLGKILRFGFFISFLYFLLKGTGSLAGYSSTQAIFFFLTFNVVDVLAQFLFREVYRFRPLVVSGDFDLILAKPMSALFRVLLGGADIIDLITIPPLIAATYLVGSGLNPTSLQTLFYVGLILNGLLIATAFHIAVISFGLITLEIDHTIMIYRDLVALGRFPVDIYKQPLQGVLTYLIPVGVMVTYPAKALMGLISPMGVAVSFGLGIAAVALSLRFWKFALTKYTSASS